MGDIAVEVLDQGGDLTGLVGEACWFHVTDPLEEGVQLL
jgi:hypothetical protein